MEPPASSVPPSQGSTGARGPRSLLPGPKAVGAIVAVNVLVWLAMEFAGGSENGRVALAFGAKWNPYIAAGEYWRLVTPIFIHFGFMHLALNCFSIISIGSAVEAMYGHLRFLVIYLVAGFAGFVLSYLRTPGALAAGASGAFFGIAGALVIFLIRNRHAPAVTGGGQLTGLLVMLALNGAYGLAQPGIDNWGHLGGFVGGSALAMWLCPRLVPISSPGAERGVWRLQRSGAASWVVVPLVVGLLSAAVAADIAS